ILNRPPEHLLVAALAFAGDRAPLHSRETLGLLQELVHHELRSDLDDMDASSPKDQPPTETGELGFHDEYERGFLTITLGIAAAPPNRQRGDLVLQACGDDPYVVEHVVRRVEEELGDRLAVVWTQAGVQRYTTRRSRPSRREARALNGFLDGTSNLRPRDNPDDAHLVFVDPDRLHEYPPLPQ